MLVAEAATSDPSLFLWGVGVYCRGPGICRQQIRPINISAIIPLESLCGFIVRRTVNGVEGTQGHVRRALMVCLSRLWFKQPSIYPKYLKNNTRWASHEFVHSKHVLFKSRADVLIRICYRWWSRSSVDCKMWKRKSHSSHLKILRTINSHGTAAINGCAHRGEVNPCEFFASSSTFIHEFPPLTNSRPLWQTGDGELMAY